MDLRYILCLVPASYRKWTLFSETAPIFYPESVMSSRAKKTGVRCSPQEFSEEEDVMYEETDKEETPERRTHNE